MDHFKSLTIQVPDDIKRITRNGRTFFISYTSNDILQDAKDYRTEQLSYQETNKYIYHTNVGKVRKAESVMKVTSSFLSDLARQNNQCLDVLEQSYKAMRKAQNYLERYKEDTVKGLNTIL